MQYLYSLCVAFTLDLDYKENIYIKMVSLSEGGYTNPPAVSTDVHHGLRPTNPGLSQFVLRSRIRALYPRNGNIIQSLFGKSRAVQVISPSLSILLKRQRKFYRSSRLIE